MCQLCRTCVFFFNDTATTEIYTLSLHDALPISGGRGRGDREGGARVRQPPRPPVRHEGSAPLGAAAGPASDRKSTRLNSSRANISYAVFCLKKKKKQRNDLSEVESARVGLLLSL